MRTRPWKCVLVILPLVALGCATAKVDPQPDPIADAGEGLAAVVAHTQSADHHVRSA